MLVLLAQPAEAPESGLLLDPSAMHCLALPVGTGAGSWGPPGPGCLSPGGSGRFADSQQRQSGGESRWLTGQYLSYHGRLQTDKLDDKKGGNSQNVHNFA